MTAIIVNESSSVRIDGQEVENPPTAQQILAVTIRDELEVRLRSWKVERTELMRAQARIAVLDGLIALAEDRAVTSLMVAPRPETEDPEL